MRLNPFVDHNSISDAQANRAQQEAEELAAAAGAAAKAAAEREEAALREAALGREEAQRLRNLLHRTELVAHELQAALKVGTPRHLT